MNVLHAMALPLLAAMAGPSVAQTTPDPPPAPPRCDAAEHRQFDFWIGDWTVTGAESGKLLGHNRIDRSADGCRLLENWRGAQGGSGQSLNAWDGRDKVWRQFWVGGDGLVLRLSGGLKGNAMIMSGELPRRDGSAVQQQRITWTPQPDGSVKQHWETSDDAGATWSTAFLGVYRRVGTPEPHEAEAVRPGVE
jgi:hypothetical protein